MSRAARAAHRGFRNSPPQARECPLLLLGVHGVPSNRKEGASFLPHVLGGTLKIHHSPPIPAGLGQVAGRGAPTAGAEGRSRALMGSLPGGFCLGGRGGAVLRGVGVVNQGSTGMVLQLLVVGGWLQWLVCVSGYCVMLVGCLLVAWMSLLSGGSWLFVVSCCELFVVVPYHWCLPVSGSWLLLVDCQRLPVASDYWLVVVVCYWLLVTSGCCCLVVVRASFLFFLF